jgi:hypothetical protein
MEVASFILVMKLDKKKKRFHFLILVMFQASKIELTTTIRYFEQAKHQNFMFYDLQYVDIPCRACCCRRSSCWKYILKLFFSEKCHEAMEKKNLNLTMDDYNAEFEDG